LSVVSLGDSLTQGDGDGHTGLGGYPPRLQTLIEALHPGSQVLNLGRSGWASADLINGLKWLSSNSIKLLPPPTGRKSRLFGLAPTICGIFTIRPRPDDC